MALRLEAGHGKKATRECPCGFFTDPQKECGCTPPQIQRYRSKVSGPLLDRIDIQVEVPALRYQELASKDADEPSTATRERVNRARAYSRVLKVARTIADLKGAEEIRPGHVSGAIHYRSLDRRM